MYIPCIFTVTVLSCALSVYLLRQVFYVHSEYKFNETGMLCTVRVYLLRQFLFVYTEYINRDGYFVYILCIFSNMVMICTFGVYWL